jgi:hypothetical protein
MSIKMNVTRMILNEKIKEEETFSLDSLIKEINLQGGSESIFEGLTIKDYLKTLQEMGILSYNYLNNSYTVITNSNKYN